LASGPAISGIIVDVLNILRGDSIGVGWALLYLVWLILFLVVGVFFWGAMFFSGWKACRGENMSVAGAVEVTRGRMASLAGMTVRVSFILILVMLPFVAFGAIVSSMAGPGGGLFVRAVAVILALPALAWVGVRYWLAPLCVVLEKLDAAGSLSRSKALVSGHAGLVLRVVVSVCGVGVLGWATCYALAALAIGAISGTNGLGSWIFTLVYGVLRSLVEIVVWALHALAGGIMYDHLRECEQRSRFAARL
jgi:hypothetical protein